MFIIIGILSAALMEYMLHRYYLHLNTHPHITDHHKIFREKYEDPSYGYKDIVSKPGYVFASSLLALLITIPWSMYDLSAIWLYVFALIYLVWVEAVHYLFHSPKGLFIEKFTVFQLLKEHHHEHHIRYKVNYGIGSTIFDHILRTKLK